MSIARPESFEEFKGMTRVVLKDETAKIHQVFSLFDSVEGYIKSVEEVTGKNLNACIDKTGREGESLYECFVADDNTYECCNTQSFIAKNESFGAIHSHISMKFNAGEQLFIPLVDPEYIKTDGKDGFAKVITGPSRHFENILGNTSVQQVIPSEIIEKMPGIKFPIFEHFENLSTAHENGSLEDFDKVFDDLVDSTKSLCNEMIIRN